MGPYRNVANVPPFSVSQVFFFFPFFSKGAQKSVNNAFRLVLTLSVRKSDNSKENQNNNSTYPTIDIHFLCLPYSSIKEDPHHIQRTWKTTDAKCSPCFDIGQTKKECCPFIASNFAIFLVGFISLLFKANNLKRESKTVN